MGELGNAEPDARAAIEAAAGGRWVLAPAVLATLAQVLIERGQLVEADALLRQCEIPFGIDQAGMTSHLPYARGQVAAAMRQWRSALACGEWFLAWRERNPGVLDWRSSAALALAQLGEIERPRELSGSASRRQPTIGSEAGSGSRMNCLREPVCWHL